VEDSRRHLPPLRHSFLHLIPLVEGHSLCLTLSAFEKTLIEPLALKEKERRDARTSRAVAAHQRAMISTRLLLIDSSSIA
jgi:hypothetical protein